LGGQLAQAIRGTGDKNAGHMLINWDDKFNLISSTPSAL
jgi:hypothetical protein